MKYSLIALMALLLWIPPAMGADSQGNYAVWGVGTKSCFHYTQAREGDPGEFDRFRSYLMGYVTAFNAMNPETYNIAGGMKLEDVLAWMDEYCQQKGMHSFDQALVEFTGDHLDSRSKNAPGMGGWR